MPGFLDLLRGGLDTVSTVRRAKDQADESDAANSVNFLMRLQALNEQTALRQSEEALRRAQTTKALQPTPARRRVQIAKDGSVSIINLDDPQDVKTVPGVQAHVPPTPQQQPHVLHTDQGDFFINGDHSLTPVTYGGKQTHQPVGRGASAEPPDVAATRRDLKDIQGQQIRAENQAKALKSEQRAYGTAHPRASKGLPVARTAADSAAVNEFNQMGAGIDSAEARARRLTQSADSTLDVLHKKRNAAGVPNTTVEDFSDVEGGGGTAGGAGGAVADPDTFTDQEIASAIAAGATTPDETIAHVTALRARKKP